MPTLVVDEKYKVQIPDDKVGDTDYITKRVDAERQYQDLMGVWGKAQSQVKAWEEQRDQLYPDPVERRKYDDDLTGQMNQLRKKINEAESLRRSMDDPLAHNVLAAGSSVGRGLGGAAAMIGDLLNFGGAEKNQDQSVGATASDYVQSLGEFPVTRGGKMAGNITEAASGGLLSAPRNMVRNTAIGAAAGTGAELTGALLNTDDPILKSLGGLGLAMPVGFAANLRKATPELARNVRNSATQDEWAAALKSMEQTQADGMPSVINQHIPRANAVDDLVAVLAQRKSGRPVSDALREQPKFIEDEAQKNLLMLQAETGGSVRGDALKLGSEGKQDLTDYIKDIKGQQREAFQSARGKKLGERANELMQYAEMATAELRDFNLKYAQEIRQLQAEPPVVGGAAGAGSYKGLAPEQQTRLDKLLSRRQELEQRSTILNARAQDPEALPPEVANAMADRVAQRASARNLENSPIREALKVIEGLLRNTTSIEGYTNLKATAKEQLSKYQIQVPPSELREKGIIGGLFKELDSSMGIHGEGLEEGLKAHKAFGKQVVTPMMKGETGRLAGKGAKFVDPDQGPTYLNLLERGTLPGAKKSEIITVGRRLQPRTLYDNVTTWYAKLLTGDSGALTKTGARTAEQVPANVSNMFTKATGQGLRDAFAIVGERLQGQGLLAKGQLPNFVRGAEALKRHADIARIRPNRIQEMSGRELDDIAKADPTLLAAKQAGPLMQYSSPIRQAELFLSNKAYQTVAENLTTPEGVRLLLKMGKVRPGSAQAEALLQSFLAGQRESQQ